MSKLPPSLPRGARLHGWDPHFWYRAWLAFETLGISDRCKELFVCEKDPATRAWVRNLANAGRLAWGQDQVCISEEICDLGTEVAQCHMAPANRGLSDDDLRPP